MKTSYSQAWLRRGVGRRRALGTLAGAGLLIGGAGCASTRETPTTVSVATPAGAATAGAAAGATAQPTATAQAKRGGVFRNAALDGPHLHLDQIADLEQIGRRRLPRPGEGGFRQLHFVRRDADARAGG